MTILEPLGHRVLVKPIKIEEKTKGGLYKPQHTVLLEKMGVDKGTVISIGETAYLDERLGGKPWVKVGDTVAWARYAGKPVDDPYEVDDAGEPVVYHILNDEDILCRYGE